MDDDGTDMFGSHADRILEQLFQPAVIRFSEDDDPGAWVPMPPDPDVND